jgi:single-stranded-DNA-specific exonuclease
VAKLLCEDVHTSLKERFANGFKKLSDLPSPDMLRDGRKAAQRIVKAIKANEKIVVVGDYDVDGVVSTALLVDFFRFINVDIEAKIPNRFTDGYGLSPTIIEDIQANLIITVDNGINAFNAANLCKDKSIDLIITDHHTPEDQLPDCFAVVNPKRSDCKFPFKDICGAQVAWYLVALIKEELDVKYNLKSALDLLSIAVVADVMPLIDVNRAFVTHGLDAILKSQRPAMIIIKDFLHKNSISSEDIGFMIAPRINSAGRMDDASTALSFLTAQTTDEALHYFDALQSLNEWRKETEAMTTTEASTQVNKNDSIIVVAGHGWHEGVVGIVASRLVSKFKKPAIVLSINEKGIAKGSARSIGSVDLYALIDQCRHHLKAFGGHKKAAGLSLEEKNIDQFTKELNQLGLENFVQISEPDTTIIGELDASCIASPLLEIIEAYEPYGEGNPKPKFFAKGAIVKNIKYFGENSIHAKIDVILDDTLVSMIAFRIDDTYHVNDIIDFTYSIHKNEYKGNVSIQLLLER